MVLSIILSRSFGYRIPVNLIVFLRVFCSVVGHWVLPAAVICSFAVKALSPCGAYCLKMKYKAMNRSLNGRI
jgi:hypothetical protein